MHIHGLEESEGDFPSGGILERELPGGDKLHAWNQYCHASEREKSNLGAGKKFCDRCDHQRVGYKHVSFAVRH